MLKTNLTRRNMIVGGGVLVGAALIGRWRYLTPPAHQNGRLTVQEAYAQAADGKITLIDIRTPREWRAVGVPEGGHTIDMRREDFISAIRDLVEQRDDAPIALICARGVRSARMTLRLTQAGFTNIIDVPEGMLGSKAGPGWIRSQLPVTNWNG